MCSKCFTCAMICLLLLSAAGSIEAETWTLDRTVKTAVRVSNSAAVEMLNAGEAEIDAVNAKKGRFPMVKGQVPNGIHFSGSEYCQRCDGNRYASQ